MTMRGGVDVTQSGARLEWPAGDLDPQGFVALANRPSSSQGRDIRAANMGIGQLLSSKRSRAGEQKTVSPYKGESGLSPGLQTRNGSQVQSPLMAGEVRCLAGDVNAPPITPHPYHFHAHQPTSSFFYSPTASSTTEA